MPARQGNVRRLTVASRAYTHEFDAAPTLCVRLTASSTTLVHSTSCDIALSRECCFRSHSSSSSQRIVTMRHGHELVELSTSVFRMPCSRSTVSLSGGLRRLQKRAVDSNIQQLESKPKECSLPSRNEALKVHLLLFVGPTINSGVQRNPLQGMHAQPPSPVTSIQLTKSEAHCLS